jgi:hypothetical protein
MSRWAKRYPQVAGLWNKVVLYKSGTNNIQFTPEQAHLARAFGLVVPRANIDPSSMRRKLISLATAYGVGKRGRLMVKLLNQYKVRMINDPANTSWSARDRDAEDFIGDAEEAVKRHNGQVLAEKLMAKGYRKVAGKSKSLARIDRPDWKDEIVRRTRYGGPAIHGWPDSKAEDFYRRVLAKRIKVDSYTLRHVRSSGHDVTGYIPKAGD